MARTEKDGRTWYPFSDDVVFSELMADEEVCREVVERCIGRKVSHVERVATQSAQRAERGVRSIRCDAFLEDAEGTRYDVEMQVGGYASLPMRFRGYQSVLDASRWEPGQDYSELGHTYVIFLCTGDPFGVRPEERKSRYEVASVVLGTTRAPLETHARWLALDASAWRLEEDEGLRNLLRYVHEEAVPEGDGLLGRIEEGVERLNRDPRWRLDMITYEQKLTERLTEELTRKLRDEVRTEVEAEVRTEVEAEVRTEVEAEVKADEAALFDALEASGRLSDYRRALTDDGFRKELESELGL